MPHTSSDAAVTTLLNDPDRQVLRFTYAGTELALIGKGNKNLAHIARALRVARTHRQPDGTYLITARDPEQMPRLHVPHKAPRPHRRRAH